MKMKKHQSLGSHASTGAHTGPGFMPGAGELHSPGSGPGSAAKKKVANFGKGVENPSSQPPGAPKGIKTYSEE